MPQSGPPPTVANVVEVTASPASNATASAALRLRWALVSIEPPSIRVPFRGSLRTRGRTGHALTLEGAVKRLLEENLRRAVETQRHSRAPAFRALGDNLAAVRLRDLTDDCEAEAGAGHPPRGRG